MAKQKKPNPTFEVGFEGSHIFPEMIPLGFLSRVLSAVRRLASGEAAGEEEVAGGQAESEIGLLQVRRGSAVYQFTAPALALARLRAAGRVLDHPETIGDRDYILSPVEELSAIAKSLHCPVILKEPGKEGAVLAKIESASYSSISEKLLIRGDTAIIGRVERVGGATEQKCGLRVRDQSRMLICRVESAEVARKLGNRLYEEVAVQGAAVWLRTSWKIVAFMVREVHQPKLGSAAEAIEALRKAGGKGWDNVPDPEAFVAEVSGKR